MSKHKYICIYCGQVNCQCPLQKSEERLIADKARAIAGIEEKSFPVTMGGAGRTHKNPPLGLVPIELLRAVAQTRMEGDLKYEVGNWMAGDRSFFVDCLSHAIEHLIAVGRGDLTEDHLGHAATNIGFILWALANGKLTLEDFAQAAKILAG